MDEAEQLLQGVTKTSVMRGRDPNTVQSGADMEPGDANDVLHLDVLRGTGKITPEDHQRLVSAMK